MKSFYTYTLTCAEPYDASERASGSDNITITINEEPNESPVAEAGDFQEHAIDHDGDPSTNTKTITLDGSESSDADGDALSYSWADSDGNLVSHGPTIRDQADYIPTSGFSIAADGSIADQFQINLEYQAGVDSDAVDTWNDWAGAIGDGVGVNWHDPEYYTLLVDPNGGLEATTYNGTDNPNHADDSGSLQWTITGWDQTILAGYIDGNRLVLSPPNTYRPFDPNLNVNVQEDF